MANVRRSFPLKYQSFCSKCSEYLEVGAVAWGTKVDKKWIFQCYPNCEVISDIEMDINAHADAPDYVRDEHNRVKSVLFQYADTLFSDDGGALPSSSESDVSEYKFESSVSSEEGYDNNRIYTTASGLYCDLCREYRHRDDFSAQMKASMHHYGEESSDDDDSDSPRKRRKYFPPPYYCLRHTGTSGFNRPAKTKVRPSYEDSSASSDEEITHNSPDRRKKLNSKSSGLTPASSKITIRSPVRPQPQHVRPIVLDESEGEEDGYHLKKITENEESEGEWDECLLATTPQEDRSSDGECAATVLGLGRQRRDSDVVRTPRAVRRKFVIDDSDDDPATGNEQQLQVAMNSDSENEEVDMKPRRAALRHNVIDD